MKRVALLLLALAACNDTTERRAKHHRPDAAPPALAPDATPEPRDCDPATQRTACVGDKVVACLRDGWFGAEIETCQYGCLGGACTKPCEAHDVELIYVVDNADQLLKFDPKKLPGDPFELVGQLTCETDTTPFSMAVDRNGIAWVRYQSGRVYKVSIRDARCSPAVPFAGAEPDDFGMGFAADGDGEKLYVATSDQLGDVDTRHEPLPWHLIGKITGMSPTERGPELTGTADGKLFGYFSTPGRGFVQELDPRTGATRGKKLKIEGEGTVGAFAFAQWGGIFYVFATVDGNSTVHAVHRATGKSEIVLQDLPTRIVGAGVSTCAPALEEQ